jgi:3-ketosteroid 9alpha-monooxygenase subunit B
VKLTVTEVIEETHHARSLVFAVADNEQAPLHYLPGQFLTLRVPNESGDAVARCYSLASSPHTDSAPKVTIKRVDGGHGSNWLCDNVTVGQVIEALPPAGAFTPRTLDADLLLWAGGSGITPVMSILKSALARGTGKVTLVYANRDERSVIFAAELRELMAQHPDRLTVLHWLESVQGLPREHGILHLRPRPVHGGGSGSAAQRRDAEDGCAPRGVHVVERKPFHRGRVPRCRHR